MLAYIRQRVSIGWTLFVVILVVTLPTDITAFRQKSNNVAISTMNGSNAKAEASVLRELKETIAKQTKEIETLKNQLQQQQSSSSTAPAKSNGHPTQSHGGHGGGGPEMQADEYMALPFYKIASHRVGWLSLFLCSLSLTAIIMNGFENTLHRQLELAYFVPLLAGHGGNTGGQTVGTVLSAMSSGAVTLQDAPRVISKEAMSGLMAGSLLGLAVGTVAHYVMGISSHVAAVVLCTLPVVSTIAATLGSSIPFLCVFFGLDPSVIAAPAMTSFVDVSGLMSYFLIANQIFTAFGIEL